MQNVSQSSLIDGGQDTVSLCLANLILTGRATPFLHNGVISGKSQHDDQFEEMIGIIERLRPIPIHHTRLFSFKLNNSDARSDIGLLIWKKDEEETSKLNMGSRYKTPNLPVWVSCVNGNWGVLFSPNKDLLKSENRWEDTASFGK